MSGGSYENLKNCFEPTLKWAVVEVVCYLVTNGIMRLMGFKEGLRLQRLAGYCGLYPIFALMVYYAHLGVMDTFRLGPEARAFENSDNGETFMYLYLSSNIVAAAGQIQTEKGALLWQLMGHHALSLICFGAGFWFDRFRFWSVFAGCCEMTNLFLVPVFAAKEMPHIKEQTWYKINGVFLWVTFVTHRFVMFPIWLYVWYSDMKELNVGNMHPLEKFGYPFTIAALFVLSGIWFIRIHKGVVEGLWGKKVMGDKKRK